MISRAFYFCSMLFCVTFKRQPAKVASLQACKVSSSYLTWMDVNLDATFC